VRERVGAGAEPTGLPLKTGRQDELRELAARGDTDAAIRIRTPHAGSWYVDDTLMGLLSRQERRADLETLAAGGNRKAAEALAAYAP
jgi:hypothetical protein